MIYDGEIRLVGTFDDLASVRIMSPRGGLAFNNSLTEFQKRLPFSNNAAVVVAEPTQVVIGVLGAENRIDIEGEARTSILYSESLEFAQEDLIVTLGVGDGAPAAWPIQPVEEAAGNGFGGVSLKDGAIVLVGPLNALAGIEAQSRGGLLSLESQLLDTTSKLFAPFRSEVIVSENEILISAVGTDSRVDLNGEFSTGVSLTNDPLIVDQLSDLVVSVSLGDAEPINLPFAGVFIPEPTAATLAWFGMLCLLHLRTNKHKAISLHLS